MRQLRLEILLRHIPVLPFNEAAAAYGRIVQQCRWVRAGAFDRMIAAHALATASILVTNTAGFADVPGLALRNWTRKD